LYHTFPSFSNENLQKKQNFSKIFDPGREKPDFQTAAA